MPPKGASAADEPALIAAPTYSDGTSAAPHSTTARSGDKATKRLNFYEPLTGENGTLRVWLLKLGALLADHRKDRNAAGRAGAKLACPADALKRNQMLAQLPTGFGLYMQHFTPSTSDAASTSKDPVTGWMVRTDPYMLGHPHSASDRYRSPNEFAPHLLWLEDVANGHITDPDGAGRARCQCKPCQKMSRSGSAAGTPNPRTPKAAASSAKTGRSAKSGKWAAAATPVSPAARKGRKSRASEAPDESADDAPDDTPAAPPQRGRPPKKRPADDDSEPEPDPLRPVSKAKRSRLSAGAAPAKKSAAQLIRSPSPPPPGENAPTWKVLGLAENNQFTTGDYVYVPVSIASQEPHLVLTYAELDVDSADTAGREVLWWPAKVKTMMPTTDSNTQEKRWKYKLIILPSAAPDAPQPIPFAIFDEAKDEYVPVETWPEFEEHQIRPALRFLPGTTDPWLPSEGVAKLDPANKETYERGVHEVQSDRYKVTDLNSEKKDAGQKPKWVIVWGPELIRIGHAVRLKLPGAQPGDMPCDVMVIRDMKLDQETREGTLVGNIFKGSKNAEGGITWTKEKHPYPVHVPSPDIQGRFYWRMEDDLHALGSWSRDTSFQPAPGLPEDRAEEHEQTPELSGDLVPETPEAAGDNFWTQEMEGNGNGAGGPGANEAAADEGGDGPAGDHDQTQAFFDAQSQTPVTAVAAAPVEVHFDAHVPENRANEDDSKLPVLDLDSNRRVLLDLSSRNVSESPLHLAMEIVRAFSKIPPRGDPEVILPQQLRKKLKNEEVILPTDIGLCFVNFQGNVESVKNKGPVTPKAQDAEMQKVFAKAMSARVRLGGQRWHAEEVKLEDD
ncbi:hypothetical protein DFJ74DRAFT_759660 [Hyaloraphidium curvatum]|nr:hypothetical protein DFJ74DRAFT_759660 [Hyaloraphidium curvatum]